MKSVSNNKNLSTLQCILLSGAIFFSPFLLILLIGQVSVVKYSQDIKPTEEFCLEGYFPFPEGYKIKSSFPVGIEIKERTTIFNRYDIFAKKICITPLQLLPESKQCDLRLYFLDLLNFGIFYKNISIATTSYPEVNEIMFEEEINNNQILEYAMTYPSGLLDYYIQQGELETKCVVESSSLKCDISGFALKQGEEYELTLLSKYEDKLVEKLNTTSIRTRTAVIVEQSSIPNNSILQNPSVGQIDLTLNKEVESNYQIQLMDSAGNNITYESTVVGKLLSIYPKEIFKQNTTYLLKVNGLRGLDGSQLESEYILQFSIDDGPKITSTNMGSGFSTSGNVVLTFNQNIKAQNIKTYVKFSTGLDYSYSIYKNQITINPSNNLDSCESYSLNIARGLLSTTDLASTNSYTYTLKTKCERVASIGTSVQGRSIYASYFGTGSKKIVFFGAMHGSESNTKTMLNKWIAELESNSSKIPSDKTIIIIPTLNPDGIANKTRFNANDVDLNRNFDSSTWVSGTYFLSNYYPLGGGTSPFSEPESVAIKNFVNNNAPYLTVSYHSAAGCVIPTSSSFGIQFGQTYSQLSGYSYVNPGGAGAFTYDITGTFEEWANENSKNALVVELSSLYADQFTQNKAAMWKMVTE